jgi:hypothetical protein
MDVPHSIAEAVPCPFSLQLQLLSALTQLRELSLDDSRQDPGPDGDDFLDQLLCAVAQLSQLTALKLRPFFNWTHTAAAAFTALTASTSLHRLQLGMRCYYAPEGCLLFRPGTEYPHLREVSLEYTNIGVMYPHPREHIWTLDAAAPMGEQQLQQMCSSCPQLEDLSFVLCGNLSHTALQSLLQLSGLTRLAVCAVEPAYGAEAALVEVAAQLTGLKELRLKMHLEGLTLLQLTALTALEQLHVDKRPRSLFERDQPVELFGRVLLYNRVSGHGMLGSYLLACKPLLLTQHLIAGLCQHTQLRAERAFQEACTVEQA